MSNTYKVVNSVDNFFNQDINKRLQNALLLKYCNPIVSLSYLKDDLNLSEGIELAKLANINFSENGCYDKNGNYIDRNAILMTIVDDLCLSGKKSLDKDDENGYFLANLVKGIINSKVLSRLEAKTEETITVDDLMAKLYGEKEEKGMVR